jgi:hypothetical protein
LAREFAETHGAHYFDLESPPDLARLEQPSFALEPLEGWVVHPGKQSYPLNDWAETLAIGNLAERLGEVVG